MNWAVTDREIPSRQPGWRKMVRKILRLDDHIDDSDDG